MISTMDDEQLNESTPEPLTPAQQAESTGRAAGADSGIPWGLGIFLLVSVLLVVFAVQNTQLATLNFFGWEGEFPLVVIIVAVAVVAIVLDEILGVVLRRRRRRRRAEKEELKRLRAERT
jgi:uncharacterized integral membrane protein